MNTSVQFSCSVQLFVTPWTTACLTLCDPMNCSNPRPPCPSPTPGVHPNPCPSSRWCHPTISSSVVPVSSCPQSFPASGCFPVSQLFTSGGHSIGVSASTSVLPMTFQCWFPLRLTDLIALLSKGLSRVFLWAPQFTSINSLVPSLLCAPTLTSIPNYWKNHSFDYMDLTLSWLTFPGSSVW